MSPPTDGRPPGPKPGLPAGAVAETVGDAGYTGPLAVIDVAAAARGDRVAFAAIYDRYAPRLYDFCVGMLRDPHAAADCVQDTFCVAARRLGQLREPDKLRPWLYAVARHEALRRIRARSREQVVEEVAEQAGTDHGPATLAGRYELAALVADAAGGLSDRDRAVLDLHYRHGLDGPELAAALGVSHTAANTMVGRLRATVERSLGALLVARDARVRPGRCPELDALLAGWDGRLTVLMRKRIARHLEGCPTCDDVRRRLVSPTALLASAPVLLPVPSWLRDHVLAGAAPHLHTIAHTAAPIIAFGVGGHNAAPAGPPAVITADVAHSSSAHSATRSSHRTSTTTTSSATSSTTSTTTSSSTTSSPTSSASPSGSGSGSESGSVSSGSTPSSGRGGG